MVEVQMLLFVWGTASMLSFASMSMVATSKFFNVPSKSLAIHKNIVFVLLLAFVYGVAALMIY
jgi:hypothetical protein